MDAAAEPRAIPTASGRDGASTPPPRDDGASQLGAALAAAEPPQPYSRTAVQPYSKSQVAFLELYNLLIQPSNPEPLNASLDKLLRDGAADGVYAGDGTTLLHAAAMYAHQMDGGANQIMSALVRAKPEQAYVASKSLGYLPLHYAACNAAPLEVIQTLFQAHPAACTTTEKKGLTPAALAEKMGNKEISRVLGRMWERERRTAKMAGGGGAGVGSGGGGGGMEGEDRR